MALSLVVATPEKRETCSSVLGSLPGEAGISQRVGVQGSGGEAPFVGCTGALRTSPWRGNRTLVLITVWFSQGFSGCIVRLLKELKTRTHSYLTYVPVCFGLVIFLP